MPRYQAHRPNAAFPCKRPVSRSLRFWRSIALRRGLDNGLSREGSLIGPRDGADAASCSAVRGMRYFLRVFLISATARQSRLFGYGLVPLRVDAQSSSPLAALALDEKMVQTVAS